MNECQDYDSWKTLLRAADICEHQEIHEFPKSLSEGEVPHIYYQQRLYYFLSNRLTARLTSSWEFAASSEGTCSLNISSWNSSCTSAFS